MAQSAEDETDDYMSMDFAEQQPSKNESSIQRRARKQREAEKKAHPKSKADLEAEEVSAREAALATSLDSSNKGFKMMKKLGFKGGALGKDGSDARTEPIGLVMKEDRGGVGLDSEKKRKFREELDGEVKKVKVDEGDYRERMRQEREEKRLEGQIIGAMIVTERLDEGSEDEEPDVGNGKPESNENSNGHTPGMEKTKKTKKVPGSKSKPLHSINIIWRNLVKHRLEKERSRRLRYDLEQSLTRIPTYDDPEEEEYDKQALGKEEEELDEEDPELDDFNALEPDVRLARILQYMRETHHYCFWCKFKYPSADLDGCPGVTEEEHD